MYSEWQKPRSKKLILSYLADWALVIIMAAAFFGLDTITPYHREFSVNDKTISFPYDTKEEIPTWMLGVISFVAPIVLIAIVSLGFKRNFYDFHCGILGLCLALSLSVVFTQLIKVTVGRPRPDFLDRCQPIPGSQDPPYGLSNYTICTTPIDSHLMTDGFKSFPSGHSSFSFGGLGYLALYFAGKLRMFDERGYTYKGFTFILPVIGALLVVITRTRDYRHHWQDVTAGSLLGCACAFFAYRQYHPALGNDLCHLPFPPRFSSDILPITTHPGYAPYDRHAPDEEVGESSAQTSAAAYNRNNRESANALLGHQHDPMGYDGHDQQKIQLQHTAFA
ncbi:PAP2-domain-containing protein [Hesseltinella vesiculosa]|uniref:PAP2-domain-containing protein n=1 Tax=Hesseltinella vesiculosa TaxID=101127 RepID=A0A1X2G628_9FUNG|nr:PAP2-domain-containing protein [Hesseltinella vesiculosa]